MTPYIGVFILKNIMSDQLNINFTDEENRNSEGKLDKFPDECPQCHKKITPIKGPGYFNTKKEYSNKALEVIFKCPGIDCREIFIGYYSYLQSPHGGRYFYLKNTEPKTYPPKNFSDIIKTISLDFPIIYNQSFSAENAGLEQICGAGYRKALEFLIKDYLLKQNHIQEEQVKIKHEQLGVCIENRIQNANIKEVAKRAAWLGNDETHYLRKWNQKDLQDLKMLIDLTVHWIEAEALTNQLLQDMPDKK